MKQHVFILEVIKGTSSLVYKTCCTLQSSPECHKGAKSVKKESECHRMSV